MSMVSSVYRWAHDGPGAKNKRRHNPHRVSADMRSDHKVTLGEYMEQRQYEILSPSFHHRIPSLNHAEVRTYAHNQAKYDRSDPHAYNRGITQAEQGLTQL